MSIGEQLLSGLELTLYGMVTVFLLLAMMVLVINGMSRLAHRLQPPPKGYALKSGDGSPGPLDPTIVSAISAAVHRFRNERR